MYRFEKVLHISASFCSLFAFIVLIFEKTGVDKLDLYRIIGYFVFCVFMIGLTMLFFYISQFGYTLFFKTRESWRMGLGMFVSIPIFFLYIYVLKCGVFLVELTEAFFKM